MNDNLRTMPTFCHISELDELGYANLHHMIAASKPLTLWAPSTVLLSHPDCRVPPKDFLRYLKARQIRIVAREPWIISRRFRDQECKWEGARWTVGVDEAIRSIYEEDLNEPDPTKRRVVNAPDEKGWERAEQYVEENPHCREELERILADEDLAKASIPPGTLQTARREATSRPDRAVLAVLRDAHNHGQALKDANADYPFLLREQDRRFPRLIAEVFQDAPQGARPSPVQPDFRDMSELTGQLLDVLARIKKDGTRLPKFLGSESHEQLAAWMAGVCEQIKAVPEGMEDFDIQSVLAEEIRSGRFHESRSIELRRMLRSPEARLPGAELSLALGTLLLTGAADFNAISFGGMGVAFAVGKAMGLVPGDFNGPQWPFLYANGRKAGPRARRRMLKQLT